MPIAFGPVPTIATGHSVGSRSLATKATFTTISIRFKTSRTYLQTLFPSDSFSFLFPNTTAEATLKAGTRDNLDWVGGGGYSFFGLWVHGVKYQPKQGSPILGSYVPLIFENSAEAIVMGREELGLPAVFSDIEVQKDENKANVQVSWRGTTFATLDLEGLDETDISAGSSSGGPPAQGPEGNTRAQPGAASVGGPPSHSAEPSGRDDTGAPGPGPTGPGGAPPGGLPPWIAKPPDTGDIFYRYIPAVGLKRTVDTEYAVFLPKSRSTEGHVVKRIMKGRLAKIRLDAQNEDRLPTLYAIAKGLSDVPVYQVLESKVEEGVGEDDLKTARRIE
jgi:hypothetical protein